MSELIVDLRRILQGLHEHGVDYVLFGATAMLFYGYIRNTEDVDIVVAPHEQNLRRVHDWLVSIDARLGLRPERRFGSRERWSMFEGDNATVLTNCGQIDLVQRLPGMPPFGQLAAEAEIFERDRMSVRVMNRETLMKLKRERSSPQDLADIDALSQLDELED